LVGASFGLSSCIGSGGDNYDSSAQLAQDVAQIDNFLDGANIDAIKDLSGVRMQITSLGTGLPASVSLTDSVDVDYIGSLFSTGAEFERGNTKGALSGYIDGWKYALTTLPGGSEATLYIPSVYAYGNQERSGIPANSILVFDVTFNGVVIGPARKAQFTKDTTAINTYMQDKGLTPVKDPTGLRYIVTSATSGPIPSWYDQVSIKYTIKLLSNDAQTLATIESSPSSTNLSRVIDFDIHGIQIGLQRMNVGSKATLYIPSGYAYDTHGAQQSGTVIIPPNSPIIVEMELISVTH